jgi:general secretion pathway protein A
MIRAYFNLKDIPFKTDLVADNLFRSTVFKETITRLDYLKQNRGIMLLTGEPGTGKSSLVRYFCANLNQNSYKYFYLPLSTTSVLEFYVQINFVLTGTKVFRKVNLFNSIQQGIKNLVTNRKIVPVFIFDEAHLFKNENFQELQIILNFDIDSVMPAIVILAGQSHLRERLDREINLSFKRRISIKQHLLPLNKSETFKYIKHCLELVGGSEKLFSDSALEAIFNNSQGNLCTIASLVNKALLATALTKKNIVSEEEVFQASKEI